MDNPLVTAIMPTTGTPRRKKLAQVAIRCFLNQRYRHKRLLILNHGESVDPPKIPNITEILVARPPTLGGLRNLAFEHLQPGDYFIAWDDDDWCHTDRLGYQLTTAQAQGKQATALTMYITVDVVTGDAFARSCRSFRCGACCGTILAQVGDIRYPALDTREDSDFAMSYKALNQFVPCEAPPTFYVRLYHGENTSSRSHVLDVKKCKRPLKHDERVAVRRALNDYIELGAITELPHALR